MRLPAVLALTLVFAIPTVLPAQPVATEIVMPNSRVFARGGSAVSITGVELETRIRDQVATSTMKIHLHNPSSRRVEAQLVMPVPGKALVKSFTYQMPNGEPNAELLPREEARSIYNSLVSRMRDPALVEFVGYNLIRSSVFPVEPNSDQELTLVYEMLLPSEGNRIDFTVPRSESLPPSVPWKIEVDIEAKEPISTVYSPTHKIELVRKGDRRITIKMGPDAAAVPGPFLLSYLVQREGVSASVMAYPDPKIGGGYFLLLGGMPTKTKREPVQREIVLVLDRSGSMRGEKIEQAKEAAKQVISGLANGEYFNLVVYSDSVDLFSEQPVEKDRDSVRRAMEYLDGIQANGGTNIHDALVEALRQQPREGVLPITLFLTDGLPTVGQTSEQAITGVIADGNKHERRVFTFGVGNDVNVPLLDQIAQRSRASSTFVQPQEDVEVKVGDVFRKLQGPVLVEPKLAARESGRMATHRVKEILPSALPDLFEGEQMIVLGQYTGEEPLTLALSGQYLGQPETFEFTLNPAQASTRHAHVPRLWAGRKVAALMDAVRQTGADGKDPAKDPKTKELVEEITRLSREFGILTEYTAFLVREEQEVAGGRSLGVPFRVTGRTPDSRSGQSNYLNAPYGFGTESLSRSANKDLNLRSGEAAVQNNVQIEQLREQLQVQRPAATVARPAPRPPVEGTRGLATDHAALYDVSGPGAPAVVYNADRTFFNINSQWVDSRVADRKDEALKKPDQTIEFGSDEYFKLAEELAKENRQSILAMAGEVLLLHNGQLILIKPAEEEAKTDEAQP